MCNKLDFLDLDSVLYGIRCDELEHAAQILVLVRHQHVLKLGVEGLQVLLNQHLQDNALTAWGSASAL